MKHKLALLGAVGFTLLISYPSFSQTVSRDEIKKEIAAKRAELEALEQQFLAPSESDRTAFAQLLSQPNTGLIRLLPRDKFESDVYKKNPKTISVRGGGAYYSFSRKTHEYGYGSDIELDSGYLSVGFAGADYGMLMKLGDIPLEEVTLDLGGVNTLAAYQAVSSEPDARVEQQRFSTGAEMDGTVYKRRLPLELGTYILRSIDFDGSDVLVAFQVSRIDNDGSIILAWRLLKKYDTPSLSRKVANSTVR